MAHLRDEAASFEYRPLFSIVVPVYNPEPRWLEQALDSVMSQVYPHWELCVCDDGSTKMYVREILSRYQCLDRRIKVEFSERNAGISGASNAALSMATGEFVGLLDHDDELTPNALFEVAKLLQEHPDADLIYSDEDIVDERGSGSRPRFKPDWSPDLLLTGNYITHLGVYRRRLVEEIGGFRKGFEGSQDYDLVLRFTEKTDRVHHIPKILYHWWMVMGSASLSWRSKPYTHERSRRALSEALKRRSIEGSVEDGPAPNRFWVKPEVKGEPKVSIIVPTREDVSSLQKCVESIERLTTYANYEVLIVDSGSSDPKMAGYLASTRHRVVPIKEAANHSKVNNFGASHARGEYLLFLAHNAEVMSDEWIEVMLGQAQRPEVGPVGARLRYPDGRIKHAGLLLGTGPPWEPGVAAPSHQYYPRNSQGYVGTVTNTRNYSAVTAACMMLRKAVFDEVGGFDEDNLPTLHSDVDLCLRLRERGRLIVYTPYAELYHSEPAGQESPSTAETEYMRERWGEVLYSDPYHNPNLSLGYGDFNLRADMLRPKILREPEGGQGDLENSYMHPDEIIRERFGNQAQPSPKNPRNSRRTTLLLKRDPNYT